MLICEFKYTYFTWNYCSVFHLAFLVGKNGYGFQLCFEYKFKFWLKADISKRNITTKVFLKYDVM